jgi:hypothetical protein
VFGGKLKIFATVNFFVDNIGRFDCAVISALSSWLKKFYVRIKNIVFIIISRVNSVIIFPLFIFPLD